eukprot:gene8801-11289_t
MDTIRKLGSSPASTGGAGVGVMNPPSRGSDSSKGKSGLSPSGVSKKPARKGAGKRVITPDEINSLFSNQKTNNDGQQSQPRDTDGGFSMFRFDSKDMEEEVEKDEVVETSSALSMPSLSDLKMPDWIRNAGP